MKLRCVLKSRVRSLQTSTSIFHVINWKFQKEIELPSVIRLHSSNQRRNRERNSSIKDCAIKHSSILSNDPLKIKPFTVPEDACISVRGRRSIEAVRRRYVVPTAATYKRTTSPARRWRRYIVLVYRSPKPGMCLSFNSCRYKHSQSLFSSNRYNRI